MKAKDQCIFPMCTRKAERDELCFLHAIHFTGPKPKKEKKPIAKESAKRKAENRAYKKMVKNDLAIDDRCTVKSPVCTGQAQGEHHKQKRTPKNLMEVENRENCCNACNLYIELHPIWSNENGHSISRFKKEVA